MNTEALTVETADFDTLGGRLSRARDAKNRSLEEVAELAGVELKTLEAWECDRAEPRSNRLTMLAGILGVSPSWLLFGRGASPDEQPDDIAVEAIEDQLDQLRSQHEKIGSAIETIEASLQRTPTAD